MHRVFETESFEEQYACLERDERQLIDKMKEQFAHSLRGKHLRGGWLFEKKLKALRLYVVSHRDVVLCVGLDRKSTRLNSSHRL